MRPVTVTEHPTGRRLYLFGRRTHHGDWGLLAVLGGLWWMVRDWKDRADWLTFRREL